MYHEIEPPEETELIFIMVWESPLLLRLHHYRAQKFKQQLLR